MTKQTVGVAGIPARDIASRNPVSYDCLQCRGQECPQLLRFPYIPTMFYCLQLVGFLLTHLHYVGEVDIPIEHDDVGILAFLD